MRGVVITLIFLAIVVFAGVETMIVGNTFKDVKNEFEMLESVIDKHEDDTSTAECVEKVGEAVKCWNYKKKTLSVYIPHNSLVELNLKVTRLYATVKCDDYTMAKIELDDFLQTLPEYNSRYLPYFGNIL